MILQNTFLKNLDRISEDGYIPTVFDVLKVRVKTTGINEIEFTIRKFKFAMTDVGGQRSERRKWIHSFEHVTAIIFCVAISEYDQKLQEDLMTNRMKESLKLFKDLTNSEWFKNTPVILFFNKIDIFEKKIEKVPLNICFKEYKGENNVTEAADYIEKQFLAQNANPNKLIFCFRTCGTDTNNVKLIFDAVKDIIISSFLNQLGIGMSSSPSTAHGRHPSEVGTSSKYKEEGSKVYKDKEEKRKDLTESQESSSQYSVSASSISNRKL